MDHQIEASSDTVVDIHLEFAQFLGLEYFGYDIQSALIRAFVEWYAETHSSTCARIPSEEAMYQEVMRAIRVVCEAAPEQKRKILQRFEPVRKKTLANQPQRDVLHIGDTSEKKRK